MDVIGQVTDISIHAPCTGSDWKSFSTWKAPPHFNPRSLHGERHIGGTAFRTNSIISIHAPCTGSDGRCRPSARPDNYFNPRSLHGERLLVMVYFRA